MATIITNEITPKSWKNIKEDYSPEIYQLKLVSTETRHATNL